MTWSPPAIGARLFAPAIARYFSTNDVLANLGVIVAGALVGTGSRLPDLAIGTAVALLVLVGAFRILRLR